MASMSLAGLNLPYGRLLTADDVTQIPWRHAKFELFDGVLVVSSDWRAFEASDLDEVPDDGHVYEVIGGVLYVNAAPGWPHQRVAGNIYSLLKDGCPDELEVLSAPFEVTLSDQTRVQPDVVVARTADYGPAGLAATPALVVEVLSPSTRHNDLFQKKDEFRDAGCPHYWVIDPEKPSILAWNLVDGEYVEVGRAVGEETVRLNQPFLTEVTPARLIER